MILAFLCKVTAVWPARMTRLVAQWRLSGCLPSIRGRPASSFMRRFTKTGVANFATLHRLHSQLSGPATGKLAERAFAFRGDRAYQRLTTIAVAHLQNLRSSTGYRRQRRQIEPTRPTQIQISQRRRPQTHGRPGLLRVDLVYQGVFDGKPLFDRIFRSTAA